MLLNERDSQDTRAGGLTDETESPQLLEEIDVSTICSDVVDDDVVAADDIGSGGDDDEAAAAAAAANDESDDEIMLG